MKVSIRTLIVGVAAASLLVACEDDAVETPKRWTDKSLPSNMPVPLRWYREDQVVAGAQLYRANCAECHGQNAQGDADWEGLGPDRARPPPPLNGTGHAWNHTVDDLRGVFMSGDHPTGVGMPSWQDKLTNDDALAIIAWLQSMWPDETYATWHYKYHRDQWH